MNLQNIKQGKIEILLYPKTEFKQPNVLYV